MTRYRIRYESEVLATVDAKDPYDAVMRARSTDLMYPSPRQTTTTFRSFMVQKEETSREEVPFVTRVKLGIHPAEPICERYEGHQWGPEESWGRGGGVTVTTVCRACGIIRKENTWGHDPVDGEEGLYTIEYF